MGIDIGFGSAMKKLESYFGCSNGAAEVPNKTVLVQAPNFSAMVKEARRMQVPVHILEIEHFKGDPSAKITIAANNKVKSVKIYSDVLMDDKVTYLPEEKIPVGSASEQLYKFVVRPMVALSICNGRNVGVIVELKNGEKMFVMFRDHI